MTWHELTELEPKLCNLEADALEAHRHGPEDWRPWEVIKRRLGALVGWHAQPNTLPELTDHRAYGVGYQHLLCCCKTGRRPRDE